MINILVMIKVLLPLRFYKNPFPFSGRELVHGLYYVMFKPIMKDHYCSNLIDSLAVRDM